MPKGTKTITIEVDAESGKVLTKAPPGASVKTIPMGDVTLAVRTGGTVVHHKIVHVPDYTVIHTQTNPTCRWIFMGGQWIQYCT